MFTLIPSAMQAVMAGNPATVAEVLADAEHLMSGIEDGKRRYDVKRRIYGDKYGFSTHRSHTCSSDRL
jgi:hypothetical protein